MEGSPAESPGKYYAAIISDVNMPVMNGIDFIKSNRALPDHQKTLFILYRNF